eukprot:1535044-Alexandrium_andersonii.AAC.1
MNTWLRGLRSVAEATGAGAASSSNSGVRPGAAVVGTPERHPEEAEEPPALSAGSAHADAGPGDEG